MLHKGANNCKPKENYMKEFGTIIVMLVKQYVNVKELSEVDTDTLAESIQKIIKLQQLNPAKPDSGGNYVFDASSNHTLGKK